MMSASCLNGSKITEIGAREIESRVYAQVSSARSIERGSIGRDFVAAQRHLIIARNAKKKSATAAIAPLLARKRVGNNMS
jgi:hypothetical protein